MDSRSPDLNANFGTPTSSNAQKDLDLNKNYNYDKCYKDSAFDDQSPISEKFINSPLLVDKKLSNSDHGSPKQSPLTEKKILNSPQTSSSREEKIINSPHPPKTRLSNGDIEEKIINSPRVSQTPSPREEFVIINPARSSVSSLVSESSITSPPLEPEHSPTFEDNEAFVSEPDANLRPPSLPQGGELEEEKKIINKNQASVAKKLSNISDSSGNMSNGHVSPDVALHVSPDVALQVELPQEDNLERDIISPVFSTTSSASPRPSSCERYLTDETLMDVLDMNSLQDSFGIPEESIEDLSLLMANWIEESIDKLKDLLKSAVVTPNKTATPRRRQTTAACLSKPSVVTDVIHHSTLPNVTESHSTVPDVIEARPRPASCITPSASTPPHIAPSAPPHLAPPHLAPSASPRFGLPSSTAPHPGMSRKTMSLGTSNIAMSPHPSTAMSPHLGTSSITRHSGTPSSLSAPQSGTPSSLSARHIKSLDTRNKSPSPLSRFSQPMYDRSSVAPVKLNFKETDRAEIATSPMPDESPGTFTSTGSTGITQSGSGDLSFSSVQYSASTDTFNSTGSYTPSYTPSDTSSRSQSSSPNCDESSGVRRSSSDGVQRSSSGGRPVGRGLDGPVGRGLDRNLRGGLRGLPRALPAGIRSRNVQESKSSEQLHGLMESSSNDSFMSGVSIDSGASVESGVSADSTGSPILPQRLIAPKKRGLAVRGGITKGRGRGTVTKKQIETEKTPTAMPRKASNQSELRKSVPSKPSGLQKPSRGGIQKPSGIAKPRSSGIARPGIRKPAPRKPAGNWDDGCF